MALEFIKGAPSRTVSDAGPTDRDPAEISAQLNSRLGVTVRPVSDSRVGGGPAAADRGREPICRGL